MSDLQKAQFARAKVFLCYRAFIQNNFHDWDPIGSPHFLKLDSDIDAYTGDRSRSGFTLY